MFVHYARDKGRGSGEVKITACAAMQDTALHLFPSLSHSMGCRAVPLQCDAIDWGHVRARGYSMQHLCTLAGSHGDSGVALQFTPEPECEVSLEQPKPAAAQPDQDVASGSSSESDISDDLAEAPPLDDRSRHALAWFVQEGSRTAHFVREYDIDGRPIPWFATLPFRSLRTPLVRGHRV